MAYIAYIITFIGILIPTIYVLIFYIAEKDQDYFKAFCLGVIALSSLVYYIYDYRKTQEAKKKSKED
jgi:hypothetical protein